MIIVAAPGDNASMHDSNNPICLLVSVVYRTSILYRMRMVHTVRVYAYGMTVRVWYGYLYHMRIATILLLLFTSSTSI